MTALERYQRLESTGLWRETPDAGPREVIVSFGDATLTLSGLDERPLGHWALAGMRAIETTPEATVYATTADGYETLAIRDAEMIAAISAVSRAAPAPSGTAVARRRQGRLWFAIACAAGLAALAAYGPGVLREHAARVVPPDAAAEYGDRILLDIMEARGPLCAAPDGSRALDALAARVLPDAAPNVRVIGLGTAPFAVLPGGTILLDRRLIETAPGPETVAGWLALARGAPGADGGVEALMRAGGPFAQLRQVFFGDIGDVTLSRAARAALDTEPDAAFAPLAVARIEAAGMGSADFVESLRAAGIAAPPGSTRDPSAPPVTGASDWAAIRGVCG